MENKARKRGDWRIIFNRRPDRTALRDDAMHLYSMVCAAAAVRVNRKTGGPFTERICMTLHNMDKEQAKSGQTANKYKSIEITSSFWQKIFQLHFYDIKTI